MLQVIRLVSPGRVDKFIAFNELPRRFLTGVRKRDESATRGLRDFLKEKGSIERKVNKVKGFDHEGYDDVEFSFPFTYFLEYQMVNADKDKWIDIVSYLRRVVDPNVRLMDHIEDMAKPCANDSYTEFSLEGSEIPVIPVPPEFTKPIEPFKGIVVKDLDVLKGGDLPIIERAEKEAETVVVQELKRKRGRPKKVLSEALNA